MLVSWSCVTFLVFDSWLFPVFLLCLTFWPPPLYTNYFHNDDDDVYLSCAGEGGGCSTDTDCCGDLSCEDGTCRQSSPSVSGQALVVPSHVWYPCSELIISDGSPSSSAGKSVEVYVPSTGQNCSLADLPAERWQHSMEGSVVCGGYKGDTRTSCLSLTDAGWERTTTLLEQR